MTGSFELNIQREKKKNDSIICLCFLKSLDAAMKGRKVLLWLLALALAEARSCILARSFVSRRSRSQDGLRSTKCEAKGESNSGMLHLHRSLKTGGSCKSISSLTFCFLNKNYTKLSVSLAPPSSFLLSLI